MKIFIPAFILALSALNLYGQMTPSALKKARMELVKEEADGIAHERYIQNEEPPYQSPLEEEGEELTKSNSSSLGLIRQNPYATMKVVKDKEQEPAPPQSAEPVKPQPPAKMQVVKKEDGPRVNEHIPRPEPAPEKHRRDGIKWRPVKSGNFNIKVQPRKDGITTPNLAMRFETIHQILRKNISWMMGGKTGVLVYADKNNFLRYEDLDGDWAGAFFSPTDNRIVMYDEPDNAKRMIELFSHELTHLFVDNFFNPPSRKFNVEPPVWMNEGLAVNMEDIASNPKGGVWANDLAFMTVLSQGDKQRMVSEQRASARIGETPQKISVPRNTVFFIKFSDFIKDDSYDKAVQDNNVENWYLQAYAMVRFLFRPYNASYPEKRIQFEHFTKMLSTFNTEKSKDGKPLRNSEGKILVKRMSSEEALRKAYGFKNVTDFEVKFWAWMRDMQRRARADLN